MKRSENRILTTHVGSLVRSQAAIEAVRNRDQKKLEAEVTDIVARQAKAGIDIVNDGEYGKSGWANYILERLTGFEHRPNKMYEAVWVGRDRFRFSEFMKEHFPRAVTGSPGHACVGPITYAGQEAIRSNIAALKTALEKTRVDDVFFTAVAPASVGYDAENEYYKKEEDYVFAIANALREEYLEIINAGFVLQVDDAVLANMFDHLSQDDPKKYYAWAELRVAALNKALEGIPEDRIRYHICFGSWHVPHVADAKLSDIVDLMLNVKAGAYSIEAANVRHEHEWKLWKTKKLPDGKILIPGVITHHTTTVEHPELVAERIVNFAGAIGKENLIAGTDCGFAQGETTQRVHPQVMWAKFESLAEGARIASKQLWG
ncbi:MAG: cobalamin-independent methionine synthase II family protein [Pseudomonadota bacterium]